MALSILTMAVFRSATEPLMTLHLLAGLDQLDA